ncbi:midasin-like protein [Nannochloropsis oceanica]
MTRALQPGGGQETTRAATIAAEALGELLLRDDEASPRIETLFRPVLLDLVAWLVSTFHHDTAASADQEVEEDDQSNRRLRLLLLLGRLLPRGRHLRPVVHDYLHGVSHQPRRLPPLELEGVLPALHTCISSCLPTNSNKNDTDEDMATLQAILLPRLRAVLLTAMKADTTTGTTPTNRSLIFWAAQCIALLSHLSEKESQTFYESLGLYTSSSETNCGSSCCCSTVEAEACARTALAPYQSHPSPSSFDLSLPADSNNEVEESPEESVSLDVARDYHPLAEDRLVNIQGILLPKRPSSLPFSASFSSSRRRQRQGHPRLILTPSTRAACRALAVELSASSSSSSSTPRPLLLAGPGGCGKSLLLRFLAHATNNADMLEMHLDDQADAKALLGAVVCGETPGEFLWRAGPLTLAIERGQWVCIEDVDRAPVEVLAALSPLLETGQLTLPGRATPIQAHANFRLFGTVTTSDSSSLKPLLGGLAALAGPWVYVRVKGLEEEEVSEVVRGVCPGLPSLVYSLLLQTFAALPPQIRRRRVSPLRDIIKVGRRLASSMSSLLPSSSLMETGGEGERRRGGVYHGGAAT